MTQVAVMKRKETLSGENGKMEIGNWKRSQEDATSSKVTFIRIMEACCGWEEPHGNSCA
jgi:hypothetical protein